MFRDPLAMRLVGGLEGGHDGGGVGWGVAQKGEEVGGCAELTTWCLTVCVRLSADTTQLEGSHLVDTCGECLGGGV